LAPVAAFAAVRAPRGNQPGSQPGKPNRPSTTRRRRIPGTGDPARCRDRYASQTACTYASSSPWRETTSSGGAAEDVSRPSHSAPRAPRRTPAVPARPAACRHQLRHLPKAKQTQGGRRRRGAIPVPAAIRPYLHLAPRRSRARGPRGAPTTDFERRHVEGAAPAARPAPLPQPRLSSFSSLSHPVIFSANRSPSGRPGRWGPRRT